MLHIWTDTFVIAVYIHTSYFESFIVTVVHVPVMSTKNDRIISITMYFYKYEGQGFGRGFEMVKG